MDPVSFMTRDYDALAQQWHRTDHGDLVASEGRPYEADPRLADAANWRDCELCDPDWHKRANPFWERACYQTLMAGDA